MAPPLFRSEHSLWELLASGKRTFDMRLWDLADERIQRLAMGSLAGRVLVLKAPPEGSAQVSDLWRPNEKQVAFVDKVTGEVGVWNYMAVRFEAWAPGWGFMLLGKRVS